MRTAIFTTARTELTIETREAVQLEQMQLKQMGGQALVRLEPGRHTVVVGPGVFKVVSSDQVRVAADSPDAKVLVVSTANDKDGDFPDPSKADAFGIDRETLRSFFIIPSMRSL